jgi:hypothetical protein
MDTETKLIIRCRLRDLGSLIADISRPYRMLERIRQRRVRIDFDKKINKLTNEERFRFLVRGSL